MTATIPEPITHPKAIDTMWRFGNTIIGAQAEYLLVPHAQANLAKIPDTVTDEQVVLLADIVTTLCPGGKERMRRLIEMVRRGRLDLRPLLTHRYPLSEIAEAYRVFGERRDGVMKVAITP